MRRVVLVAAVLIGASGCKRSEPAGEVGPPVMSTTERERALTICKKYVERICGCADEDPALRDGCELSRAQPEAVQMHLDVLEGAPLAEIGPGGEVKTAATGAAGVASRRPPLNDGERRLTEESLRKVVAACVKLDAELDLARCPRI